MVKNPPANAADVGSIRVQEDPLEEEMANHFSILAWEIPWPEEHGRLYSSWGHKESDTTENESKIGSWFSILHTITGDHNDRNCQGLFFIMARV